MPSPRVVVTRTITQAPSLCDKLRAVGFTPIMFPTIQLKPLPPQSLDHALTSIETFDWLIFTSGNAVNFFFQRVNELKRPFSLPRIAVSGSATASKLRQHQIQPDFVPGQFVGEALAAGLGNLTGQKVLLPRAKLGRPKIADLLQEQGATVTEISLYDTVTAVPTLSAFEKLVQGFEAITFTSPSSVRNFLEIIKFAPANRHSRKGENPLPAQTRIPAFARMTADAIIACIGPITAKAATKAGLTVTITPNEYTISAMVQKLTLHFGLQLESTASEETYD